MNRDHQNDYNFPGPDPFDWRTKVGDSTPPATPTLADYQQNPMLVITDPPRMASDPPATPVEPPDPPHVREDMAMTCHPQPEQSALETVWSALTQIDAAAEEVKPADLRRRIEDEVWRSRKAMTILSESPAFSQLSPQPCQCHIYETCPQCRVTDPLSPVEPTSCPKCGDTPVDGLLRCAESTRGRCPMKVEPIPEPPMTETPHPDPWKDVIEIRPFDIDRRYYDADLVDSARAADAAERDRWKAVGEYYEREWENVQLPRVRKAEAERNAAQQEAKTLDVLLSQASQASMLNRRAYLEEHDKLEATQKQLATLTEWVRTASRLTRQT